MLVKARNPDVVDAGDLSARLDCSIKSPSNYLAKIEMSCSLQHVDGLIKEETDEESKKCKSRADEERTTPRLVTVMQINKPSTRVGVLSSNTNSVERTT